jgi:two-component system response regulator NreC
MDECRSSSFCLPGGMGLGGSNLWSLQLGQALAERGWKTNVLVHKGFDKSPRMDARAWPDVKVIILTMHDEAALVQRMIDLGADGYLVKNCSRDELMLAIRDTHAGRRHFGSALMESLLQQRQESAAQRGLLKELSEREVEVLAALAEGLTNKEIGERLFISPRTVDTHRTNLMKKLDVHNVAGLVRIAMKSGLVA